MSSDPLSCPCCSSLITSDPSGEVVLSLFDVTMGRDSVICGSMPFRRMEVLNEIMAKGIVPVFFNADFTLACRVVDACQAAGIRVFEWTNRGQGALGLFRQLAAYAAEKHPGAMMGVGSIVDAPTAAMYIDAGACFVVGPVLDRDCALLCNKRKVPYSPGTLTPSEIHTAHELGCEIIKIFPGGSVGPSFVQNLLQPIPWACIMPTGGVSPSRDSIFSWVLAGATCVGLGGALFTPQALREGDFDSITSRLREALVWVEEARAQRAAQRK